MRLLVIYDIGDDGLRVRTAELLKDFGLERVQYSAFAGDLTRNRREMMEIRVSGLLDADVRRRPTDRVYVLPMCDACFGGARFLGEQAHFPDRRRDRFTVL
jgi:CRISPR-associated protein Cas2